MTDPAPPVSVKCDSWLIMAHRRARRYRSVSNTKTDNMEPAILANPEEVCDYLELTEAASRCSFWNQTRQWKVNTLDLSLAKIQLHRLWNLILGWLIYIYIYNLLPNFIWIWKLVLLFNVRLGRCPEQGSHSRPEAEAVGGAVDHDLTEGWHNNQDEDGHDLHEESEAPLPRQHFSVKSSTAESKTFTTPYILFKISETHI